MLPTAAAHRAAGEAPQGGQAVEGVAGGAAGQLRRDRDGGAGWHEAACHARTRCPNRRGEEEEEEEEAREGEQASGLGAPLPRDRPVQKR